MIEYYSKDESMRLEAARIAGGCFAGLDVSMFNDEDVLKLAKALYAFMREKPKATA